MGQVIEVKCSCGTPLFKYFKDKKGNLIKLYLHEIRWSCLLEISNWKTGDIPKCPNCQKDLGIVTLVHGKPALKVKRATINMRT